MCNVRSLPFAAAVILGWGSVQLAACGGGGASPPDNPPDNPGGGGSGSSATCGLSQANGATLAGPAEGAWGGLFPVLGGVDAIGGSGVVAADGAAFFTVGNSELWVGSVLALEHGSARTALTRYARPITGGPGGPRNDGDPLRETLVFDRAVTQTTLSGAYVGALSNCQDLALSFDDRYLRPASLAAIAGVYTASEEDGYALTVTIHADGQLDGADTQGCVLLGAVAVPDATRNIYRAIADASSCGNLNGHYQGMMSLRDLATSGDNLSLDLALSAPDTAIFYRLSR